MCKSDTKLISSRIKNLLETENVNRKNIILIKQKEEGEYDLKKLGKIAYLLGARKVHTLENWDRYPIEKVERTTRKRIDIFEFKSILSYGYNSYSEKELEGILYFEAYRGDILDRNNDFFGRIKTIKNAIGITKDIIIINKSDNRLVKKYNMKPAMPYVEKKIKDWFNDTNNIGTYCTKEVYDTYRDSLGHIPDRLIIKAIPEYANKKVNLPLGLMYKTINEFGGLTNKQKKTIDKLSKTATDSYEKFCNIPLVKYTCRYSISHHKLKEFEKDLEEELKLKGLIK